MPMPALTVTLCDRKIESFCALTANVGVDIQHVVTPVRHGFVEKSLALDGRLAIEEKHRNEREKPKDSGEPCQPSSPIKVSARWCDRMSFNIALGIRSLSRRLLRQFFLSAEYELQ